MRLYAILEKNNLNKFFVSKGPSTHDEEWATDYSTNIFFFVQVTSQKIRQKMSQKNYILNSSATNSRRISVGKFFVICRQA